ncbi:PREDICTED: F-box protein At3g22700-like, partial [Erythranthe guttata]|uniref:F-box protein At3g22700-like n=1 Tax=Erythranthe guttata TaxID=4155 RepID=UPI00064DBE40
MDEIKEKLPYDVVEIILSRLPSKSLLRFKSVCKSWNATISGERFAGVHLRQSRQSSGNQDIFFWCEVPRFTDFSQVMVTKIPQHIRSKMKLEQLEHEQKLEPRVLCYCDGLALLRYGKLLYNQHGELVNNQYVLCNLSAGTHVEFYCPYDEISYIWHKRVYGICYDPSINDYKVIIIDYERYAIYYCRAMRWSEIRETPDEFLGGGLFIGKSVSLNGDLYFMLKTVEDRGLSIKIVGFDSVNEKFKRFPELTYQRKDSLFMYMTCVGGYLYVCFNNSRCQMIKVGGGEKEEELMWVDLNGRPPNSEHVECDMASNIQEYENVLAFDRIYCIETGYQQIPYLENLFISEPRRKG